MTQHTLMDERTIRAIGGFVLFVALTSSCLLLEDVVDTTPSPPCTIDGDFEALGDYNLVEGKMSLLYSVNSLGNNRVFGVGAAMDASDKWNWIFRSSSDNGVTWSTEEVFVYEVGQNAFGKSAIIARDGAILVVGYSASANMDHLLVRRKALGESGFTTVDDFQLVTGKLCYHDGATVLLKSGDILVTAHCDNASNQGQNVVRKSTDNGLTWTTVDSYGGADIGSTQARPTFITQGSDGSIYLGGYTGDSTSYVRASFDDGATWDTVLSTGLPGKSASAKGVVVDTNGDVYAVTKDRDAGDIYHSYIRKSTDRGATWTVLDSFQISSGEDTEALGIFFASDGTLIVGGYADVSGVRRYFLRTSKDKGVTWENSLETYFDTLNSWTPLTIQMGRDGSIYSSDVANEPTNTVWTWKPSVKRCQ